MARTFGDGSALQTVREGATDVEQCRATYLGAPAVFLLSQACCIVQKSFGNCYLVGSCLTRRDFRDVDVRVMLDDAEFERLFPGGTSDYNPVWSLICSSISLYLSQASGLPVDFQIQRTNEANAKFRGRRHALGIFQKGFDG